jgi:hypothetical protein
MKRRQILVALAVAPLGFAGAARGAEAVITVYKDPG